MTSSQVHHTTLPPCQWLIGYSLVTAEPAFYDLHNAHQLTRNWIFPHLFKMAPEWGCVNLKFLRPHLPRQDVVETNAETMGFVSVRVQTLQRWKVSYLILRCRW